MGNTILTPQLSTTIDNQGSAIILNGQSKNEFGFTLESGTNRRKYFKLCSRGK